eukprot:2690781-Rhodomonas_salina.4
MTCSKEADACRMLTAPPLPALHPEKRTCCSGAFVAHGSVLALEVDSGHCHVFAHDVQSALRRRGASDSGHHVDTPGQHHAIRVEVHVAYGLPSVDSALEAEARARQDVAHDGVELDAGVDGKGAREVFACAAR